MSDRPIIRPVTDQDTAVWLSLRSSLWPTTSEAEHRAEMAAFFAHTAREPQAVLVAEEAQNHIVGFVELSIRPYAEGCHSQQVAYVEGWYVVPA
jgi:aminoglycoside 6'-N-acetyltransferase I